MKLSSTYHVLAMCYVAQFAEALGAFKLDFTRESRAATHLSKRANSSFEVPLVESSLYQIKLAVGNPPQVRNDIPSPTGRTDASLYLLLP
jgi:hypothetical protein